MVDFRRFVGRCGGRWIEEPGPGYGVITKGDASVYLSLVEDVGCSVERYDDKELAAFRRLLEGRDPKSLVQVQIGHTVGSRALAGDISTQLAAEWDGVQDWSEAE